MYVKDATSGVIINNEDSYYKALVARRQEKEARETLAQQVNSLQQELLEIKSLLRQVLTGTNHG
jgi:hypothetical protein